MENEASKEVSRWKTRTHGSRRQIGTHFRSSASANRSYKIPSMEVTKAVPRYGIRPSLLEKIEEENRQLECQRELQRIKDAVRMELERLVGLTHSSDEVTRAQAKAEIERRFPAEYKHLFAEEPRPAATIPMMVAAAARETRKKKGLVEEIGELVETGREMAAKASAKAKQRRIEAEERKAREEKAKLEAREAVQKREEIERKETARKKAAETRKKKKEMYERATGWKRRAQVVQPIKKHDDQRAQGDSYS
jgi:hypothetical protein